MPDPPQPATHSAPSSCTALGTDASTTSTTSPDRLLVFHCLGDAQRGLVALHTTAERTPEAAAGCRRRQADCRQRMTGKRSTRPARYGARVIFARTTFTSAVTSFETAIRARDSRASKKAFDRLQLAFRRTDDAELAAVAPRLAALLPDVPPGPRSVVAVVVGACVERGADPTKCAPAVLAGLREALFAAAEFVERWTATGGGDLPEPDEGDPDEEVVDRVGPDAAQGWWTLPQWEMATVALLSHQAVRGQVEGREELIASAAQVAEVSGGGLKCLTYALLVLDDEPLVVLHRESGTGYRMRMSGLGDNFQLHTLLAAELVGAGHVPGEAPTPEAVAVCRDVPGQVPTAGTFELAAPDGSTIWNEGTPSDIAVVDDVRLLVLDPPAYSRGWSAGRFFPGMPGELVLERVLDASETEGWFDKVADAKG